MNMDTLTINRYILEKPLKSENSGFSKWGIGTLEGKKYFIKEFLSPVYPADDAIFTEKKKQDKILLCKAFVDEKKELYSAVREADDGHIIAVEQFFRAGAKYYISTKAVSGHHMSIADIHSCNFTDCLRLCCSISHAMANIHKKRIIHADIKPDNILVIKKRSLEPHIIDFDCSFFDYKSPELGQELNGDMVYLSPEGFLHIAGIESNLSCKMDVFALGLLFCQYLTGNLPLFDKEEYQYAYEAVLDDQHLGLEQIKNKICRSLIEHMLSKQPENRPDMQSVFLTLKGVLLSVLKRNHPEESAEQESEESFFIPASDL